LPQLQHLLIASSFLPSTSNFFVDLSASAALPLKKEFSPGLYPRLVESRYFLF
jgi:hypothetical protein